MMRLIIFQLMIAVPSGAFGQGAAPVAVDPPAPLEESKPKSKPTADVDPESSKPVDPVLTVPGEAMGTGLVVKIFVGDQSRTKAQEAADAAIEQMTLVDARMSEWQPTSDIGRLNAAAGDGQWIAVAKETLEVLKAGQETFAATQGAFAMTWHVLSPLWDFRTQVADGLHKVPAQNDIQPLLALIDDGQLAFGEGEHAGTARLLNAKMSLGLGGIAKGFALDRAMDVLVQRGFANALIFAGGDIRVMGQKGDEAWLVGLQDPRGADHFALLTLRDESIATSGDYEHYFEQDAKRYHHILSPKTGMPAGGCHSVSVVAKSSMRADAAATAVFVMGPKEGMAWVESQPDLEAVMVDDKNEVLLSTGLKTRVRVLRAPGAS